MSYQVLARKWRPKNFAELMGQEHVVRALTGGLQSGRLHHAFLFTGTRGVGKTTIARIIAKALNCDVGVSATPCGVCSACLDIDAGRFPDLLEVDAASRTKVDDTREILDNVVYAPARGRFKVYLIDEVHMLSISSFNALLKTLEEPPAHVKFLLATTDPQKLPVTVLSRCLKFHLKRLSIPQIAKQMGIILRAEQIDFETDAVDELARAADGSMRDGLSLLDQALSYGDGKLATLATREMLGTVSRESVLDLLDVLAEGSASELATQLANLAEFGGHYGQILGRMLEQLHQLAFIQLAGSEAEQALDAPARLVALAPRFSPEELQLLFQLALLGTRDVAQAPDPRIAFEMCLLRMLTFRPVSESDSPPSGGGQVPRAPRAPAKLSGTEHVPSSASEPQALPSVPREAAAAARTPALRSVATASDALRSDENHLADRWHNLVSQAPLSGPASELARNAVPLSWSDDTLVLGLEHALEVLSVASNIQLLRAQLAEQAVPRSISVHLLEQEVDQSPARRELRARLVRQAEFEASAPKHPLVAELIRAFDAKIQPQSIRLH